MDELQPQDVPYGNDWDSIEETAAYGASADRTRPWRSAIRERFAEHIAALPAGARVLELGSGPGLLAQQVLKRCPDLGTFSLLDFSLPMLQLSQERLAAFTAAAFVHGSFKDAEWMALAGGPFDCVVSMQAVHELRHKRHASTLYRQVFGILSTPGLVLICDHLPFDATAKSVALM